MLWGDFINKEAKIIIFAVGVILFTSFLKELPNNSNKEQIFVIEEITTTETTIPKTTKKSSSKNTSSEKTTTKNSKTKSTKMTTVKVEITTEAEKLYININSASHEELVKLKGIGDHLAEKIITYRNENGGFKNIEELINVSGIGEKIFASIAECVYVENPIYNVESEIIEPEIVVIEESQPIEEVIETTVYIPVQEEYVPVLEDYVPININEADIELLMLLPYVDEEIAEKIIALRNDISGFSHVYELLYVDGLNKEKVSEIIKYICI